MINPSCTILGPGAATEGVVPRCPTKVREGGAKVREVVPRCPTKVREDGEASENPEDWGECHSDCPLRAYRDNQVIRINIKNTLCKKKTYTILLYPSVPSLSSPQPPSCIMTRLRSFWPT